MRFPMILAALLTIGGLSASPASAETKLAKAAAVTAPAPVATQTIGEGAAQYRWRGGYRGGYGYRHYGWRNYGYRSYGWRGGYRPHYRYAYRPRYYGYHGWNRGWHRGWHRRWR